MKVQLFDSFNNVLISSHRTIKAAVIARHKHIRATERKNGKGSYVTYRFEVDGRFELTDDEQAEISHYAWALYSK